MIFDFLIDAVERFVLRIAHPDMLPKNRCHLYTDDHRYAAHGCWFLSPRMHAINLVYIPPLLWMLAYYLRHMDLTWNQFGKHLKRSKSKLGITDADMPPYPLWLPVVSIIIYLWNEYFKIDQGHYWRLMHNFNFCNIAHVLVIICSITRSAWLRYHLARFIALIFVFVFGPIFMPDWNDLKHGAERIAFLAYHALVCLFTIYNIHTSRLDFSNLPLVRVIVIACLVTPLYVWSQTILSLVSGTNINSMPSPPSVPGRAVLNILGEEICQWGHVWGSAVYIAFFVMSYIFCLKAKKASDYYKRSQGVKAKPVFESKRKARLLEKGGVPSRREESPVFAQFNRGLKDGKDGPRRRRSRIDK